MDNERVDFGVGDVRSEVAPGVVQERFLGDDLRAPASTCFATVWVGFQVGPVAIGGHLWVGAIGRVHLDCPGAMRQAEVLAHIATEDRVGGRDVQGLAASLGDARVALRDR